MEMSTQICDPTSSRGARKLFHLRQKWDMQRFVVHDVGLEDLNYTSGVESDSTTEMRAQICDPTTTRGGRIFERFATFSSRYKKLFISNNLASPYPTPVPRQGRLSHGRKAGHTDLLRFAGDRGSL